MKAIELEEVWKSFDSVNYVLRNINFSVEAGSVLGLLGPNGAGKTTTVRLLNGILKPTKGRLKILGKEVMQNLEDVHRLCGVMTDTAHSYEQLTGKENLIFFARMYGMGKAEAAKEALRVMELFHIADAGNKKAGEYSTGMKKRLSLARAFIHNPKILFLDEPTSGLDPEAAAYVNRFIKKLSQEENVTVLLCTHQLKYAEEICTHYGFIDKGVLLASGTFDELLIGNNETVYLSIKGKNIGVKYEEYRQEDGLYKIPVKSDKDAAEIISSIVNEGGKVYEAARRSPKLEDIYFSYLKNE
jgi:ABC-2 type transport system ATP-binding protein